MPRFPSCINVGVFGNLLVVITARIIWDARVLGIRKWKQELDEKEYILVHHPLVGNPHIFE